MICQQSDRNMSWFCIILPKLSDFKGSTIPLLQVLDYYSEAGTDGVLWKSVFLKISQNSQPKACNFIKKGSLTQVFSCQFCEIFKNTFFTEHLRTIASVYCILHLFYSAPRHFTILPKYSIILFNLSIACKVLLNIVLQ